MRSLRSHAAALLASVSMFAASGCHKPTEGGVHLAQVVSAFDSAGWKASAFVPVDAAKFSAQKCVGGAIEGLDTVVCEFGSDEATKSGKKAAEAWIANAVTGVALINGRSLLALADRSRTDPLGKSIHAVTKTYTAIK